MDKNKKGLREGRLFPKLVILFFAAASFQLSDSKRTKLITETKEILSRR
jgi:hypothetical protein